VKAHMGRIMRKTGVGNRIELTMYILNRHVEPDS
jgi:DNA-binding NarL/FixJ family response regulator